MDLVGEEEWEFGIGLIELELCVCESIGELLLEEVLEICVCERIWELWLEEVWCGTEELWVELVLEIAAGIWLTGEVSYNGSSNETLEVRLGAVEEVEDVQFWNGKEFS